MGRDIYFFNILEFGMTCCAINRSGSEDLRVLFRVWHEQKPEPDAENFSFWLLLPWGKGPCQIPEILP